MKIIALAAVAAGLAVAGGASAATNLITNGSFEAAGTTGTAAITTPWTYTEVDGTDTSHPATVIAYNSTAGYPDGAFGEPIPTAPQAVGDPDAPGKFAAYFVADDATETLSQSIFLNPGFYSIGFSAYVPQNGFNNSGDATFTGTVAGKTLVTFDVHNSTTVIPPQTWETWTGTLHVTTAGNYDTDFIYHSGTAPAADVVIDNVFVVAGGVPEPASWALMIMGFGAAGAMLRRRQSLASAA
ncbi:MAG TPA: PEPxxWA-CTERM sorting domain-containing protein [Phenylobacterium sp.]|jgi:hypothetical protein|uniref:PEPxxWA-CTERM sorting domain-containing protein n=1 Tax=Phenylobacterium sp. TaxID=1871053 RepID=UPI002D3EF539|nr:PEPxxWA-CTERM sorting domain-containing protein [Phenylobacterium sp.]HZZ69475.1 PEPxxWA-CTERM sorting domain-containing protein [Phenylobacterium sp.]